MKLGDQEKAEDDLAEAKRLDPQRTKSIYELLEQLRRLADRPLELE